MVTPVSPGIQPSPPTAPPCLIESNGKEHDMDDTAADDRNDEVVVEFDQTNSKAPGLEGDGRDVDTDGDPDFDPDPALEGNGSSGADREPLITRMVDDIVDPDQDERRD
jgi:hypothetical protein